MNLLKRWEETEFPFLGQKIRLRIKAPNYDEAPELLSAMAKYGDEAVKAKAARQAGDRTAGANLFSMIEPALAKKTFERCVKPAPEQFVEGDDGEAKALVTGLDVYEIANSVLVLSVMNEVQGRAILSEAEGKASASPSTSGAGTEAGTPDSGGSPATITEPEGGPAH